MAIIFQGISYPFRKGDQEFPQSATDDVLIKESVIQILQTTRGDRLMRPEFGSNVLRFIFEPNEAALGELIYAEVHAALSRWEPRIELLDVRVTREDATVVVTVDYGVIATRTQDAVSTSYNTAGA